MFSTKKDFALLARQISLPTRETTKENSTPFLVDIYQVRLWKLIHSPEQTDLDDIAQEFQCNSQELLHTLVALYDKCLSEIGGETIYSTICERKVVSILIVYNNPEVVIKQGAVSNLVTDEEDCLDTLLENIEEPDSVFHDVFSDASSSESSEEEDEDGDEDEDDERDYSIGVGKFLKKVKAEKLNLHKRLIGSLSFQKITMFPTPAHEEHVLDLLLLACRKKYRGRGIGRYLMKLLMNRDYIGDYDAIITASDQGAINFYRKFGFTEDAILLSKYKDIGDCWTNTTKMCYLPPYNVIDEDPIRCLTMMDDQFQKWQKSMFHGYQNQAALFQRLKHEMIGLYAKINAQDQTIVSLNRERFLLAKENAALKVKLSESASYQDDEIRENEQLETLQMIREMEKISILNEKLLVAQMSLLMDDDCTTQMAVEYCRNRLKDAKNYEIKAEKITLDGATIALYQSSLPLLHNGNQKNETLLFYSGHSDHIDIIANAGFTNEDFLYGSVGKGLYFHTNIKNLQKEKYLLCKVALGRIELISKPKTKSTITLKRNTEYDSVKILDMDINVDDEIVVFDSHLALPLFIITFE
ncbi:unnamed protein product [Adineta steineri]|uniref:N-acetyltransferase domain-containing protein n=3 Tax=Adineta steineri TaxID=433720 RepID=A0A814M9K3_9BILA|nr:unnamed protein product [Adineta steineri]CAF1005672.1 unnamed protein product [Adineta steineri]CAF1075886.1 unnamed protein product [Adineta steineri]